MSSIALQKKFRHFSISRINSRSWICSMPTFQHIVQKSFIIILYPEFLIKKFDSKTFIPLFTPFRCLIYYCLANKENTNHLSSRVFDQNLQIQNQKVTFSENDPLLLRHKISCQKHEENYTNYVLKYQDLHSFDINFFIFLIIFIFFSFLYFFNGLN